MQLALLHQGDQCVCRPDLLIQEGYRVLQHFPNRLGRADRPYELELRHHAMLAGLCPKVEMELRQQQAKAFTETHRLKGLKDILVEHALVDGRHGRVQSRVSC